ncbi:hypothetical protein Emed_000788 [Eimeria media]
MEHPKQQQLQQQQLQQQQLQQQQLQQPLQDLQHVGYPTGGDELMSGLGGATDASQLQMLQQQQLLLQQQPQQGGKQ